MAPALAAQPVPIPLTYNWNGIVHSGEAGLPDDPNGFRSVSDRALDFSAGIPADPVLAEYQLVNTPGVFDLVHLGNRNLVSGGAWLFDAAANADMIGTQPAWLPAVDMSGPQTSVLPVPMVIETGTVATFLFQISNGGGSFDVTIDLISGMSVTGTLTGGDWFNGPLPGTGMVDLAAPSGNLNVVEGSIALGDFVGDLVTEVTFSNSTNPDGAVAILAANLDRPARVLPGREACAFEPFGFTLIPTFPGYIVTPGATFDPNFANGSIVSAADDAVVGGQMLSFPFTMPGGSIVNTIAVDTNGRLLEDVGEGTDFNPTVGELLGDASSICPLWGDMSPNDADALGSLWFYDDGTGTSASVTWDRIPQFQGNADSLNIFQVRLLSDSSIEFFYQQLNVNNVAGSTDVVIGVSAGNGAADPDGESDLTGGAVVLSADDVVYELYDAPAEDFPFSGAPNDTVSITATSLPVLGTNFDVDVNDTTGTAVAVAYFFGFPTGIFVPSIPLGGIIPALAGCEVLTDIVTPGAVLAAPSGVPGTPTTIIAIPNAPALIGIEGLVVSGIVVNPGLSPSIYPTDELVTVIGL